MHGRAAIKACPAEFPLTITHERSAMEASGAASALINICFLYFGASGVASRVAAGKGGYSLAWARKSGVSNTDIHRRGTCRRRCSSRADCRLGTAPIQAAFHPTRACDVHARHQCGAKLQRSSNTRFGLDTFSSNGTSQMPHIITDESPVLKRRRKLQKAAEQHDATQSSLRALARPRTASYFPLQGK